MRRLGKSGYRSRSDRLPCRSTRNRSALVKATSGPRGTGPTGPTAITGYRAPGYWLRRSVISGHRAGGDGAGADSSSTTAIGDHVSVSMAGLSTDMVISVAVTMAGVGRVIASSTIVR